MQIYKIRNIINDKIYIGQTIQSLKDRFREHCKASRATKSAVTSAIRKYGKDNFTIEPLMTNITDMYEMDYWERFWIKIYDSISPNGYNLTTGGKQCKNLGARGPLSAERKAKISKSLEGNQFAKGYKHSEETRKKVGEGSEKQWAERLKNNPNRFLHKNGKNGWSVKRKGKHYGTYSYEEAKNLRDKLFGKEF